MKMSQKKFILEKHDFVPKMTLKNCIFWTLKMSYLREYLELCEFLATER